MGLYLFRTKHRLNTLRLMESNRHKAYAFGSKYFFHKEIFSNLSFSVENTILGFVYDAT